MTLNSFRWAIGLTCFLLFSCTGDDSDKTYKDQLVIHTPADPQSLHPINSTGTTSTEIKTLLFQKLLQLNFETLELTPVLAKQLPSVEVIGENEGMLIEYELREGLLWDDGVPITAKDVEFSFKCVKNPKVDAAPLRPYFSFVKDFKIDPSNPLKFTLVCDEVYILWDHSTGTDAFIFPKHLYDPNGVMDNFSFSDIALEKEEVIESQANLDFAKEFNDVKYSREAQFVNGSGPYELVEWQTNQRVMVQRKNDWYGEKLVDGNIFFENGPQRIIYETISDMNTALVALKAGKLDVLRGIPVKDWVDLDDSNKIFENFRRSTTEVLAYTYFGLHLKEKKFANKKTRQALAYLVDYDGINQSVLHGFYKQIVGPIHPSMKNDYNSDIQPYNYDTEKAKKLLAEAGWKDSDGNGWIDQRIDGELYDFKIELAFLQVSSTYKNMCLIFQESARQVGINVELRPLEWSVFLQDVRSHDLEMFCLAWSASPRPSDPIQLWHTDSYNGGSNYTGFGNSETNQMIENIRRELDPAKRSMLYKEWQTLLHEEVPYIFLYTYNSRRLIHKRFTNLSEGPPNPGFWAGGFQLAPGYKIAED